MTWEALIIGYVQETSETPVSETQDPYFVGIFNGLRFRCSLKPIHRRMAEFLAPNFAINFGEFTRENNDTSAGEMVKHTLEYDANDHNITEYQVVKYMMEVANLY